MEVPTFFHTRGWDRAGLAWPLRLAAMGVVGAAEVCGSHTRLLVQILTPVSPGPWDHPATFSPDTPEAAGFHEATSRPPFFSHIKLLPAGTLLHGDRPESLLCCGDSLKFPRAAV